MAHPSNAVAAALEAVRRTTAAQAATIDALEHAFDAEMALLARDRRALEDDRAAFVKGAEDKVACDEEEKARIQAAAPPPDEVVKLNVGGARFETSRAVLTKVEDSMLGRMFGRCDAMLQADPLDGSIFIDRDGERFRVILDFLRDLNGSRMQRTIRALAETAQDALVQELDYFGLEVSVFGLRPWNDGETFRPGPELSEGRSEFAAVAAGGRVVVFGGLLDGSALDSTEVLDTRTMAFAAGPDMLTATMAFAAGPDMLTARYGCAAVQIDGNRVLLVGGADDKSDVLNTTEILHLSTLTFTPGPNMQSPRCWCAAVALDARRILVGGGFDGESRVSTTEILSLDSMIFAPGPAMTTQRSGCAAVALGEHRVMVAGGISGPGQALITSDVLDIHTMAFTPGPSMGLARCYCTAVQVDAEHVLVIGGDDSLFAALATTELLNVATMAFEPGPAMRTARHGSAVVRLDVMNEQPRVVVIGGENRTTRGSDEGEDKEEEETICLSSTEVLAVEQHRGAPAARRR